MAEEMERYTRQMDDCRKRWKRQSLEFVLESARILQEARQAAESNGCWSHWLREKVHMNRVTAYRHMKVASFIGANVALKQHLTTLGLTKIYAITRLKPELVSGLVSDPVVREMSDARFAAFIRPHIPVRRRRPSPPNLLRSILATLARAEKTVIRWQKSPDRIPGPHRARILARIQELLQIIRGTAVA